MLNFAALNQRSLILPLYLMAIRIVKKLYSSFQEGNYRSMLFCLGLVLGLFTLSRLLFQMVHYQSFPGLTPWLFLKVMAAGLRFDLSTILILNLPFVFLNVIPFTVKNHFLVKRFGNAWFFIINTLALLVNLADMYYFRFTHTRATAEIFSYLGTGEDFISLLPSYLKDYWMVPLLGVLFGGLLVWALRKANQAPAVTGKTGFHYLARHGLWFVLLMYLTIIGSRGGWQLRPISVITAGKVAGAQFSPLVTNTPFSILKSYGKRGIQPVHYFEEPDQATAWFNPVHSFSQRHEGSSFRPCNVMILIMEGFSGEFSSFLNPRLAQDPDQGLTPFLDSLMAHSLVFEKAYANATRSIEALPAVISSIPHLMETSYILSVYGGQPVHSLPLELGRKGYSSHFFHGGTNGTMGFDAYARVAGFDHYYGREEFNNESFYDGTWGIYDEPFLQFVAETLNTVSQPFLGTVFTLSSHHPYTLPADYQGLYPNDYSSMQQSVLYADHALRQFFKTASQLAWFQNTLFVITADHTSEWLSGQDLTRKGKYHVPLVFFHSNQLTACKNPKVAQHTDIMPTVLDYLHYDHDFLAFGHSLFDDSTQGSAIHYLDNVYQLTDQRHLLFFDGQQASALYDHQLDPLLEENIIGRHPEAARQLTLSLQAAIQQYNNRIINNQLKLKQ